MEQIPLTLTPTMAYDPDEFFNHAGVTEVKKLFESSIQGTSFSSILVQGDKRFGKTHLLINAMQKAHAAGRPVRFLEHAQLESVSVESEHVIFIDNLDLFLQNYSSSDGAGSFVSLYEALKVKNGVLVATYTEIPDSVEPHVGSRIAASHRTTIKAPADIDIEGIFFQMAKQRGISLSERKRLFVVKRVGRDTASIERYLERVMHLSHRMGKKVEFSTLKGAF